MYLFIIIVSYLYLLFILFSSDSFAFIHSSNKDNKQFEVLKVENYLVSIHEKNIKGIYRHICSGTILSERWVLTAAHCVYDSKINATLKPSVLSISHIRTFNGFLVPVLRIVVHPGFIKRSDCIGSSNLALLQTTMSFDIYKEKDDIDSNKTQHEDIVNDDFAKHYEEDTAIIPDPKLFKFAGPSEVFKGTCYAVSWVLKDDKENGAWRYQVNKWEVKLIPTKKCEITLSNIGTRFICTLEETINISTYKVPMCQIDPGAILLCNNIQIAVLRTHYCYTNLPTVWTRLDKYLRCLQNIILNSKFPAEIKSVTTIRDHIHPRRSFQKSEPNVQDTVNKVVNRYRNQNRNQKRKIIPKLFRAFRLFDHLEAIAAILKYKNTYGKELEPPNIKSKYRKTFNHRPRPVKIDNVIPYRNNETSFIIAVIVYLGIVSIVLIFLCVCCGYLLETNPKCCKKRTTEEDEARPSNTGNVTPRNTGNVTPRNTGNVTPRNTGNVTPSNTGNVTPSNTGNVTPGNTGNLNPSNTGNITQTTAEINKI